MSAIFCAYIIMDITSTHFILALFKLNANKRFFQLAGMAI